MELSLLLPRLLGTAWLLPLFSFALVVLFGPRMGKAGKGAALVATGAILGSLVCSLAALLVWTAVHGVSFGGAEPPAALEHSAAVAAAEHASAEHEPGSSAEVPKNEYTGDWYTLVHFGHLKITIGYYIDALTVVMFAMVSIISTCIHFYSIGYMHEELHEVTDHEVTLADGEHLHRRGRFHRFFQYLSLFCFSMLGIVIAGNIAMVFVFWELVGICSYFLIGFYIERQSATNAANKAFIVNRIGDFGMIVGMCCLFGALGTFQFGGKDGIFEQVRPAGANDAAVAEFQRLRDANWRTHLHANDQETNEVKRQLLADYVLQLRKEITQKRLEIFQKLPRGPGLKMLGPGQTITDVVPAPNKAELEQRAADVEGQKAALEEMEHEFSVVSKELEKLENAQRIEVQLPLAAQKAAPNAHALRVPDGMVVDAASREIAAGVPASPANISRWREQGLGYGLLILAGLGIFCGCMGKSAQFPIHVWLPDAMEGPTPVSALVHSATMVAAGVYLVGRFYPVFTPEVLLVIAIVGCITLFMAATIAITAVDIKRVLAYSTLSQLGYMMFALGVGGWLAGMLHLITHAFFKSLLFMCSGSVIHAVHSNDMREMGGLRRKMPITAYTMLVGCLAISGAGLPLVAGLSGYYSKDAILAQALAHSHANGTFAAMFYIAAGGAAITAFYMFRLWYMTFTGKPRSAHRFEHAHESPPVMWVPLVVLSFFAIFVATPSLRDFFNPAASPLVNLLEQARPMGTLLGGHGGWWPNVMVPGEHASHAFHVPAGLIAFSTALAGFLLATIIYGWRLINPSEVRQAFEPMYRFLWNKWWFDELYDFMFVRPTLAISRAVASFDRLEIDGLIDGSARAVLGFSDWFDRWIDRLFVDGAVNYLAERIFAVGLSLRAMQTGRLRQYVVLIVVGTVALFLIATFAVAR